METKLILLSNNNIDIDRWNRLISNAPNARVYAESWYLDIVAPNWMGLVYGNYDYVMPIVKSKKFSVEYAFQPLYCQQHGIFPPATPEISKKFIEYLKQKLRYFNLSLNSMNVSIEKLIDYEIKKNYLLQLNKTYENLYSQYKSHTRRYLPKAIDACQVMSGINPVEYLKMKKEFAGKSFSNNHYHALQLIVNKSIASGRGIIYGAYSKQNQLIAAAFFLKSGKRAIYLNSISLPEGKESRVMLAIVDRFITDHANSPVTLDFEGSMIDGIARFFAGFGAQAESYQVIKHNNLPFFIKLFKK
jgi:hypothetical protein